MQFGRRRVDVVGYWPGGRLLIEIHVTHRVGGKKLKEVRAADEFMLEIDVPKDQLYSSIRSGPGSLRELILDGIDNKRWLHHPEGEAIRQRLLQKIRSENIGPQAEAEQGTYTRPVRTTEAIHVRGGHVPSRSARAPEDYAYDLYLFLSGLDCDGDLKKQMVRALRVSGHITNYDIELAEQLGHPLRQLVHGI